MGDERIKSRYRVFLGVDELVFCSVPWSRNASGAGWLAGYVCSLLVGFPVFRQIGLVGWVGCC